MAPRQPNMPFGPGMQGRPPFGMGPHRGFQQRPPVPFNPYQGRGFSNRQAPVPRGLSQQRGGGGLLSKILGMGSKGARSGPVPPVSPFSLPRIGAQQAAAASGSGSGLLQSLTNTGSLTGFLNNTQKVLQTAQQVGPLVNQYGPIIKNIPAMWKLYRGLKSAGSKTDSADSETDSAGTDEKDADAVESDIPENTDEEKNQAKQSPSSHTEENKDGRTRASRPKIFF